MYTGSIPVLRTKPLRAYFPCTVSCRWRTNGETPEGKCEKLLKGHWLWDQLKPSPILRKKMDNTLIICYDNFEKHYTLKNAQLGKNSRVGTFDENYHGFRCDLIVFLPSCGKLIMDVPENKLKRQLHIILTRLNVNGQVLDLCGIARCVGWDKDSWFGIKK